MTQPTEPTGAELDRAIIDAARELIAARRSGDPARIETAQAEYDRLKALKAASA